MLKLKLQYFGHLMRTYNSLEKSLMLGKIEGRRGHKKIRWLDHITDAMNMNSDKLWEMVRDGGGTRGLSNNNNNNMYEYIYIYI